MTADLATKYTNYSCATTVNPVFLNSESAEFESAEGSG